MTSTFLPRLPGTRSLIFADLPSLPLPEDIPISNQNDERVNDEINARKVRLVDEEGENRGVMPLDEALRISRKEDQDLVEVAPDASPPVCRIMDYGKYKYEQQKKRQRARQNQQQTKLKEVRFRPRTEEHDLNTKRNQARSFLEDGNIVRVTLYFKGREIVYKDQGKEKVRSFAEDLEDISVIQDELSEEGHRIQMTLAPKTD